MITSSHNPAEWNGVKYKASYGGSGRPSIISAIEGYLDEPLPKAPAPATIEEVDFKADYIAAITNFVDLDAIKASGQKFLIDCMYGAGRGVIAGIFTKAGIPFVEIRSEINPAFSGHQSRTDPSAHQGIAARGGCGEVRCGLHYRWRRRPYRRSG